MILMHIACRWQWNHHHWAHTGGRPTTKGRRRTSPGGHATEGCGSCPPEDLQPQQQLWEPAIQMWWLWETFQEENPRSCSHEISQWRVATQMWCVWYVKLWRVLFWSQIMMYKLQIIIKLLLLSKYIYCNGYMYIIELFGWIFHLEW